MRIAFITPTLGEAFGQERVLHESVRLLESVGHQCWVATEKTLGDVPTYLNYSVFPELSLVNSLSPQSFIKEKHEPILFSLKKFKPDIVHFVDLFDYRLVDEIAGSYPSVLTAHSVSHTCPASHRLFANNETCTKQSGWACLFQDFRKDCLGHFASPLHKLHAIQNFLSKKEVVKKRFKKIIAISDYMKKTLIKDGYDPRQIETVYNPISENHFEPAKTTNRIICVARLVPLKGVDHFIRSLAHLTVDYQAEIYGDGPEKEKLKALVENLSLGKKVEFMGKVSRKQLITAMGNAQFLVQTNLGPEGFGLAVAESMLLGTPVVAYDIPALNELIVSDKTGFLVNKGREKELAEKMERLFLDPNLRLRFAQNAKERAKKLFSCQSFLEKTEKIYREVTGAETSIDSKILSSSLA